ncbi:putative sodium/glucose cotransporter 4 [Apostichopus japonicus]|uniref:Putative sodium/glucose cotransporter 4 n=1 Tax=Stichopus japonicus TaxID=307972 RepID=A0A2G8JR60_STIJA|nr:putative sodium/glucose cotransporter 4 [Apostichopus japonicus]
MAENQLEPVDIVVISIHFVVVLLLGIWSSYKANRSSTAGYFLAGRSMSWWLVGLSLYVTNIGSGSFIGLAGTASASGYAVIAYEFTGLFCLLLLGFVFMPVYISSGISTVPEYLNLRFGGSRLRLFLAVTSIVLTVLSSLSSEMYAGALIIQQTLGWNIYLSVILLLAMTVVYTITGGLTAVIYTDALQAIIMLVGAFILAVIAWVEIGGIDNLYIKYMAAVPKTTAVYGNSSCGIPQENAWHIFRPASDPDYPWPGVLFGITLLSAYYWCTNQILVQRSLAAKNITHSKAGSIMAAYLKLLPMVLMVFPGMVSRALFPDEIACQSAEACEAACSNPAGCSDIAYPKLVLELMPVGIKGLMLAAMLAALMSSLTSIFNSLSSLFALDLWSKYRPDATELELTIVGRVVTVIIAIISILWLPVIQVFGSGELFVYIQSMTSYLSPPMFAVYSMGMFWERTTEPGAFYGLILGAIIGLVRLVLDFVYTTPGCGEFDDRPGIVKNFHYLHFALVLYAITVMLIGGISLMTPPIPSKKLVRLTWWTRNDMSKREPMEPEEEGENTDKSSELQEDETEREKGREEEDKEEDEEEDDDDEENKSIFRKCFNFVCGTTSTKNVPELTEEEKQALLEKMTSIKEEPFWERVNFVNGVICLGIGVFCFGFWG